MALTGDFARLELFRRRLQAIARGGAQRQLCTELANETHKLIIAGFVGKQDPYGRRWAPRRPTPAWVVRAFGPMNHPLLDKSGKMIDGFRVRATATGLRATTVSYAGFHQSGTRKMVARKLVPDSRMGMGPTWGNAYLRVAGIVGDRLLGSV